MGDKELMIICATNSPIGKISGNFIFNFEAVQLELIKLN